MRRFFRESKKYCKKHCEKFCVFKAAHKIISWMSLIILLGSFMLYYGVGTLAADTSARSSARSSAGSSARSSARSSAGSSATSEKEYIKILLLGDSVMSPDNEWIVSAKSMLQEKYPSKNFIWYYETVKDKTSDTQTIATQSIATQSIDARTIDLRPAILSIYPDLTIVNSECEYADLAKIVHDVRSYTTSSLMYVGESTKEIETLLKTYGAINAHTNLLNPLPNTELPKASSDEIAAFICDNLDENFVAKLGTNSKNVNIIDSNDIKWMDGTYVLPYQGNRCEVYLQPSPKATVDFWVGIEKETCEVGLESQKLVFTSAYDCSERNSTIAFESHDGIIPNIEKIVVYTIPEYSKTLKRPGKINFIDNSNEISGIAKPDSMVYCTIVRYGSDGANGRANGRVNAGANGSAVSETVRKTFCAMCGSDGKFLIPLDDIYTAGTLVQIYSKVMNSCSPVLEAVCEPQTPIIQRVKRKKRIISGICSPNAKVRIKIGSKKFTVRANDEGCFCLKLKKRKKKLLKKNVVVSIFAKVNGLKSRTTIKVVK